MIILIIQNLLNNKYTSNFYRVLVKTCLIYISTYLKNLEFYKKEKAEIRKESLNNRVELAIHFAGSRYKNL